MLFQKIKMSKKSVWFNYSIIIKRIEVKMIQTKQHLLTFTLYPATDVFVNTEPTTRLGFDIPEAIKFCFKKPFRIVVE